MAQLKNKLIFGATAAAALKLFSSSVAGCGHPVFASGFIDSREKCFAMRQNKFIELASFYFAQVSPGALTELIS